VEVSFSTADADVNLDADEDTDEEEVLAPFSTPIEADEEGAAEGEEGEGQATGRQGVRAHRGPLTSFHGFEAQPSNSPVATHLKQAEAEAQLGRAALTQRPVPFQTLRAAKTKGTDAQWKEVERQLQVLAEQQEGEQAQQAEALLTHTSQTVLADESARQQEERLKQAATAVTEQASSNKDGGKQQEEEWSAKDDSIHPPVDQFPTSSQVPVLPPSLYSKEAVLATVEKDADVRDSSLQIHEARVRQAEQLKEIERQRMEEGRSPAYSAR
jgi:hypothetical protein